MLVGWIILIILAVNELIKNVESDKTFRLLWIDENNFLSYAIDIEDKKALPFVLDVKEISQGLIDNTYIKLDYDKSATALSNLDLTDKQLMYRDNSWNIIKDLVQDEPSIYRQKERGQYIKKLVEENVCTKRTAYRYLRRYWQKGKTVNCLIPEYGNSGGRNINKKSSDLKRGLPRKSNSIGINVTEETREIFKKAIKKYYFSDKKNSMAYAYKMMIKEFYAYQVRYENGVKHVVIQDENKIPTMRQFRYWYNKEFGIKQTIVNRQGKKKFERDHRQVLGSSTYETMGPGSRYQIDATIGNLYLISSYNSDWIIGRPIIYFVVDVFTHMITGTYIGLEGPSWAGMMMAIENATIDKVEFCSKYGIEISNEWWPSAHLPEIIVGDRGELEGYQVNNIINGLNVSIENNPSFRPDWKGIVEKLFDTSQEKIKPFLPGYIQTDFGERGAEDYRLQAKLTLEQYTKIIINFILHYNKNYYMKDYPRDVAMIEADVKPTPIEIWNWGIRNRAGKLRKADADTVRFYLMPTDKATITPKGIRFKGMLYSCKTAIKESWFIVARNKRSWKVDISYDPRNVNNIYIHTQNENLFELCSLLEHQDRYKDKIIEEVEQLIDTERNNFKNEEHNLLQEEINLYSSIESIVENSIKSANETQTGKLTKAQKTKSIRGNRQIEKTLQRGKEAFHLEKANENCDEEIIEFNDVSENNTELKNQSIMDLFNKKRGGKNE